MAQQDHDQLMIETLKALLSELIDQWSKDHDAEDIGCDPGKVKVLRLFAELGSGLGVSERDLSDSERELYREVFLRNVWGNDRSTFR